MTVHPVSRALRVLTVLPLLGLLGVLLALTPAPADAAVATSRTVSREAGGDALLTDYPADGHPVAGRTYSDTIVSTARSVVRADGTTSEGAFASFATTRYSFDTSGAYVEGSQTSGYGDGAAVQLVVDPRLRTAHLHATVMASTCALGACSNTGPVQLEVDWSAIGPTTRTTGRQRLREGRTTMTSWTAGDTRSARAVVSGLGTTVVASLWRGTSRQQTVQRS